MLKRFLMCTVLAAVASPLLAADSCWPQWRGVNRDGKAADANIGTNWDANPPKLLWTVDGLGEGYASCSIADGKLYTTGNVPAGQAITAVDLKTHKVLWQTPLTDGPPKHGYSGSRSTPTIDGDRLYVVTSDGEVACATTDGDIVWKKDFESEYGSGSQKWGYAESPLVDGDLVIVTPGGSKALMVALNKSDGTELWRTPYGDLGETGTKEAGYSSVVVSNGGGVKQYVQNSGKGAVGVRASDGKMLWHYNRAANKTAVIPTALIDGDYVFVSSGYQAGAALLKLSADKGGVTAEEVYFLEAKDFQNHHGQMILHDGYVYAGRGHGNGFPVCVELKTGKIVWGEGERGPGKGSAAVIFADGQLIFRYQNGLVALIEASPKAYKLNGTFTPKVVEKEGWSHPVVCGGTMYLREQNTLMAYDISPETR